jgi:hypothetical protein
MGGGDSHDADDVVEAGTGTIDDSVAMYLGDYDV